MLKFTERKDIMCSIMGYCDCCAAFSAFKEGFDKTVSRGPDDSRIIDTGKGFLVAKEGLDFLCPAHTVIEALCVAFFIFIEGVEQIVHPFFEFFLFFFW